jgi:hypothetical protein
MTNPAAPAIFAFPWVLLAVIAYIGTLTLGTLSLAGRSVGRVWHARLFVLTATLTIVAAAHSFFSDWVRGASLLAALVPLGLLPWLSAPVRAHTRRHAMLGLCAAPFYVVALTLWVSNPP